MPTAADYPYSLQLEKIGVHILEAAESLVRLFGKKTVGRGPIALTIHGTVAQGKAFARSLQCRLSRTLLNQPNLRFACETSRALERMLGFIKNVSARYSKNRGRDSIPFTHEISCVLFQQSQEIAVALSKLRNGRQAQDHCTEIIRLEEEMKRLYESSYLCLFETAKDPIEVMRCKLILDNLLEAAKAGRCVADVIKLIQLPAAVKSRPGAAMRGAMGSSTRRLKVRCASA